MRIIKFIALVIIILVIILAVMSFIRSSISYTSDEIAEINKLHDVGIELCKNNDGLSAVRFNTIFHHKVYCNNYTTIKYAGEL